MTKKKTLDIAKNSFSKETEEAAVLKRLTEQYGHYEKISRKRHFIQRNKSGAHPESSVLSHSLLRVGEDWFRLEHEHLDNGFYSSDIKEVSKLIKDEAGNIHFEKGYLLKIANVKEITQRIEESKKENPSAALPELDYKSEAEKWNFINQGSAFFTTREKTKHGPKQYLLMKKQEGVTLEDILNYCVMDFPGLCGFANGLVKTISNMHKKGLAHGDAHEENILFKDKTFKFIDYGASVINNKEDDSDNVAKFEELKSKDVRLMVRNLRLLFAHCLPGDNKGSPGVVYQALQTKLQGLSQLINDKNSQEQQIKAQQEIDALQVEIAKLDELQKVLKDSEKYANIVQIKSFLKKYNKPEEFNHMNNILIDMQAKSLTNALHLTFETSDFANFDKSEVDRFRESLKQINANTQLSATQRVDKLKNLSTEVNNFFYGEDCAIQDTPMYQKLQKEPVFTGIKILDYFIATAWKLLYVQVNKRDYVQDWVEDASKELKLTASSTALKLPSPSIT